MNKPRKKIKKYLYLPLFFIPGLLISCFNADNKQPGAGKKLAVTHCGSCHALPDPASLDKNTWRENVLPVMANKLGLDYIYETSLSGLQKQLISIEDFKKIAEWYYNNAPDTMEGQNRPPIKDFTNAFTARTVMLLEGQYPSTSYVKIDPGNHWIYAANAFDSSINIYNARLKLLASAPLKGTLIDMNFDVPLLQPGIRKGILTLIGIMNPNDLKTGAVHSFSISEAGSLTSLNKVLDSLPRPVQTIAGDLDMNGVADYLVCGFGNTMGGLLWIIAPIKGKIEKRVLRDMPGAIKAYTNDFNNDGLTDIMVLMAQAHEGIFLFINRGNGRFDSEEVLSFPAIYGSSYFELADFNKDGFTDILYTCGDNADYTGDVLKNYHGLYVFLNDGNNHFKQNYFFPLHGCYKAMARDFDKDGDLDIAAISYFPDEKNQPKESFVYLEETGNFQFTPYTIKEFKEGKWLTMDTGDIDGDGDEDIVLGSLVPPYEQQQQKWKKTAKQKAALLLLENKQKH